MTTLTDFLAVFYRDEDEMIYLRAFKAKGAPDAPDNYPIVEVVTRRRLATDAALQSMMKEANKTRGWYFVVNAGGNADVDITRFNAFFAENDRLSISEQHERLDAAPIQPSIRLVTKKSVHAHFLLIGACDGDAWRDVQGRLIAHFDGDVSIKNPSRVMRLPFFNHVHYDAQTGKYEYKHVEIHTFLPDVRFTVAEMQAAFPEVSQPLTPVSKNATNTERTLPVVEKISVGSRHRTLLSVAGSMRRRGLGEEEIFAALRITNQLRCQTPLDETELLELCHDVALRYSPETPSTSTGGLIGASDKPTRAKEFLFTSLDRLIAEPEEDVSFVWENTLPVGGISICSAKPKVGKSTLARNLALAVSRGDSFLGRETVKGKVLYLCLEEKRAEIAKHFRRMGTSDDDIHVAFATPENALTALEFAIAEHSPALTIIDPLSRVVRVRDFNDYGTMSRALEPFIDLARKMACHILALHHDGKGDRDGGDAVLGSTALFAAVDCHIQMKKRERGRTIQTTQRYGEDMPELVVELEKDTGVITAQGDLQTVLQADKKKEILSSISDTEALTEEDIKERVEGPKGLISKALRALVADGKLVRNGLGRKGNPYTYRKDLENPTNLSSDVGTEVKFSRFVDIEQPGNLEISESEAMNSPGEQLFMTASLPEHSDLTSSSMPESDGYLCWNCSTSTSSEDVRCPNCDQYLVDLPC